jgi:uncharacterized membrane protein
VVFWEPPRLDYVENARMIRLPHPFHPALVHFPIACWVLALPCDVLAQWWYDPHWAQRAADLIAAGILLALPAMVAGLVEFGKIDTRHPASTTAYWHLALVSGAWLLYLVSWILRFNMTKTGAVIPGPAAVGIACAGLLALIAGAWYGAHLVYHHGIGQRP